MVSGKKRSVKILLSTNEFEIKVISSEDKVKEVFEMCMKEVRGVKNGKSRSTV